VGGGSCRTIGFLGLRFSASPTHYQNNRVGSVYPLFCRFAMYYSWLFLGGILRPGFWHLEW
jgi:hypothetical protein